jgi:hypothetical protein
VGAAPRIFSGIDSSRESEDQPQSFNVLRLNAGLAAALIEARKPFVGEAPNHSASVFFRNDEPQPQRLAKTTPETPILQGVRSSAFRRKLVRVGKAQDATNFRLKAELRTSS